MKFAGGTARQHAAPGRPQIVEKTLKYSAAQEPLLRRLASALVLHWDSIPDEVQDVLIDQAVLVEDAAPNTPNSADFESFLRRVRATSLRPPVKEPL
ncbi:MAG: hypothetical protein ABW199_01825 [Caulobacterales bacterium]